MAPATPQPPASRASTFELTWSLSRLTSVARTCPTAGRCVAVGSTAPPLLPECAEVMHSAVDSAAVDSAAVESAVESSELATLLVELLLVHVELRDESRCEPPPVATRCLARRLLLGCTVGVL